ncbi:MAG: ATP synthase subunit I [Betaproteobacteria bacterium]
MIPPLKSKPFRTVFRWQAIVTLAIAAIAGVWAGGHGALSAGLGGIVNLSAGVVFAFVLQVSLGDGLPRGAGPPLIAMFRAEAAKVMAILGQLWLVLSTYKDIVPAAFFTAFVATVIVFSMAFFVRD